MNYRLLIYILIVLSGFLACTNSTPKNTTLSSCEINIFPDYKNVEIPVNIAPLNFKIESVADDYFVQLCCKKDTLIPNIKNASVSIPLNKWKKLLSKAIDDSIKATVFFKTDNKWSQYKLFYWKVSPDSIDSYLSYRLIDPNYVKWYNMGIYQRNLSNFKQEPILENKHSDQNCMNCHSFNNRNPKQFMLHLRANPSGTLIVTPDDIIFANTKTEHTLSAGVYPAWHPSGKYIAMSTNRINQKFHNHQSKSIEVFDKASDIIVFDIKKREITTSPKLTTLQRENMPTWSPDGKYLYFIKAPQRSDSIDFTETRYDLFRIAFDANTRSWGNVDTVLIASEMGKSVTFPRISPDGKYLLLTLSDYGYFTIHHSHADLYLFNIEQEKLIPLSNANSNTVESYHSWSSNSKWIVFSSKRLDGVAGRPYFCHIDENGIASNPFVLPQKNPDLYTFTTQSFNIPELIRDKVSLSQRNILKMIYQTPETISFDSLIDIDAITGATKPELIISPYERN